jgi:ribosomal protein S7
MGSSPITRKMKKILAQSLPPIKDMKAMVNFVIKKGNKNMAESIIKKTLFLFTKTIKKRKPQMHISKSIKNITPVVNVVVHRRKHRSFQVPAPILKKKKLFLINHWLLSSSRAGAKQNIYKNLSNELYLSTVTRSYANKKRKELHALAISLRKKSQRLF